MVAGGQLCTGCMNGQTTDYYAWGRHNKKGNIFAIFDNCRHWNFRGIREMIFNDRLHTSVTFHTDKHDRRWCNTIMIKSIETGSFNPIALKKAKIVYNFGHSECNRVKQIMHTQNTLLLSEQSAHCHSIYMLWLHYCLQIQCSNFLFFKFYGISYHADSFLLLCLPDINKHGCQLMSPYIPHHTDKSHRHILLHCIHLENNSVCLR